MLNFLISLLECSAKLYLGTLVIVGVSLIPEFLFQCNKYRLAVKNHKALKKIEVANASRPAPPSGGSGVPNKNRCSKGIKAGENHGGRISLLNQSYELSRRNLNCSELKPTINLTKFDCQTSLTHFQSPFTPSQAEMMIICVAYLLYQQKQNSPTS